MRNTLRFHTLILAAVAVCLLVAGTGVWAQEEGDLNRLREGSLDQERAGYQDQDRDRDNWRNQLHKQIDAAPDLTPDQRATMHANLDACFELGVTDASLEAVFPGEDKRHHVSAQAMLRLQNRIMTAAREGLPVEPMLNKIQEGRTKGVPEPLLERACERMENHVRTANRIMQRAMDDGVEPPRDQTQSRRMQKEMAQQMWRGMDEEGYDQLRERARLRLRDGECGADDLVAAGEVATRLLEAGAERQRAVRFSGEALRQGYRAQELRRIQLMVAAQHQPGKSLDGFFGDMEHCVGAGMGAGEMYNYMMRHGWMGPGDMYGPGGYHPTDHKGHGGGNQGGGDHQGGGGSPGGGGNS